MSILAAMWRAIYLAGFDPIDSGEKIAAVGDKYGPSGTLAIASAVIVAGMSGAVYVLWRSAEKAKATIPEIQAEHYRELLERAARDAEARHKFSETIGQQVDAIKALRDTLDRNLSMWQSGRDTLISINERIVSKDRARG